MRHADLAVFAAKAEGKRCYVVYTPDLHGSILEGMRVETELRRALEHDEFVLFYQPIVDLESGRITTSKRSSGGIIRNGAWCSPTISSPWPSPPD